MGHADSRQGGPAAELDPRVPRQAVNPVAPHPHLPAPDEPVPTTGPVFRPRQARANTPGPPRHSGKTGFPAMARFFGRRNTIGEFVPTTLSDLQIPSARSRYLAPVAVVLLAAMLSFLAVLAFGKLRKPAPTATAPPLGKTVPRVP